MPNVLRADDAIARRFDGLARMVGNTPLLAIEFTYRGEPRTIYAKCEQLNGRGASRIGWRCTSCGAPST